MPESEKKIVVFATSFLDMPLRDSPDAGRAGQVLEEAARRHGLVVEYRCDRVPSKPLEPEELKGVVVVIADLEKYEPALLKQVGSGCGGTVQLIARYGIGYNNVDVHSAHECGVVVTNTPRASAPPTAEWAVATMMAVSGRSILQHRRASAGKTKSGPSRLDISSRTLGIIGTGTIGKRVIDLLSGFKMRVLAYDPYPDRTWAAEAGVEYSELSTICSASDFISLHASGQDLIIGNDQLNLMKRTTVLVNCARGPMVDNRAAWNAVKEDRLYGYALDEVWEHPDLPLEGLNIMVSPHVGSDTDYGKLAMQIMSAEAVAEFLNGQTPVNLVRAT